MKSVLLTGASRGIGHATVKKFGSEGWRVITCSRQEFAAKYGVRNIPTVLMFKGGEVVGRQVGVAPKNVYTEAIDGLL